MFGVARRPFGGVRNVLRTEHDLLENAMSLAGTTVATSVLGVGFWWIAARFLTPSSVGYGSAALSAVSLLATFGVLGFGTLLMGQVASGEAGRGGLIATGLLAAGAASAVLGIAFGLVVPAIWPDFVPYTATALQLLLFVATVSFTGISLVLDNALVGLFLGRMQLERNIVFAVVKLAVLALVASRAADDFGVVIVFSWSSGILISFGVVAILLLRGGKRVLHAPRIASFQTSARPALMHHWLNLATYSPRTALPLVVTATLSASLTGTFYPAWLLATTIYIIPNHLSTSLFAVGSSRPDLLRAKTWVSVKVAVIVGLPVSLVLIVFAHPILQVFGGSYAANATRPFQLLMLAYVPNIVRFHYVTIRRVQDRLGEAATMMSVLGVLEITSAAVGAALGGLTGMTLALTAAMWLEAALTVRPVIGAMGLRLMT